MIIKYQSGRKEWFAQKKLFAVLLPVEKLFQSDQGEGYEKNFKVGFIWVFNRPVRTIQKPPAFIG